MNCIGHTIKILTYVKNFITNIRNIKGIQGNNSYSFL